MRGGDEDDINDILGATTGQFEFASDDGGSAAPDHDLDDMLGESTGDFAVAEDTLGNTPPRTNEVPKRHLVKAHLAYLDSNAPSLALEDVRNRIRALTIEKQKLYRAMAR